MASSSYVLQLDLGILRLLETDLSDLVGALSTDAQLVLNKRVKILLHCTVSDAAVEQLNVPTMFPV